MDLLRNYTTAVIPSERVLYPTAHAPPIWTLPMISASVLVWSTLLLVLSSAVNRHQKKSGFETLREHLGHFVRLLLAALISPPRPKNLNDLDEDIMLDIFCQLDASSVLSLKRTNRWFYRLSQELVVWHHVLESMSRNTPHMAPRLERPLAAYTAKELENAVKRALWLEENWSRDTPTPISIREIALPRGYHHLTPASRWLISYDEGPPTTVYYRDLNETEPVNRFLFETHIEGMHLLYHPVASGIDETSHLTFNLLLRARIGRYRDFLETFEFWSIRLNATCSGLEASRINTFNAPSSSGNDFVLDGDLLAQSYKSRDGDWSVLIYDWRHCSTVLHVMATVKLPKEPNQGMALLPCRRLLVTFPQNAVVYDIPPLEPSPLASFQLPQSPRPYLWVMPFARPANGTAALSISPIDQARRFFHVASSLDIYTITLPHDQSNMNFTYQHSTAFRGAVLTEARSLGTMRGVACTNSRICQPIRCLRTTYSQDSIFVAASNDVDLANRESRAQGFYHEAMAFDERSGRLVLLVNDHGKTVCRVIDFAHS